MGLQKAPEEAHKSRHECVCESILLRLAHVIWIWETITNTNAVNKTINIRCCL